MAHLSAARSSLGRRADGVVAAQDEPTHPMLLVAPELQMPPAPALASSASASASGSASSLRGNSNSMVALALDDDDMKNLPLCARLHARFVSSWQLPDPNIANGINGSGSNYEHDAHVCASLEFVHLMWALARYAAASYAEERPSDANDRMKAIIASVRRPCESVFIYALVLLWDNFLTKIPICVVDVLREVACAFYLIIHILCACMYGFQDVNGNIPSEHHLLDASALFGWHSALCTALPGLTSEDKHALVRHVVGGAKTRKYLEERIFYLHTKTRFGSYIGNAFTKKIVRILSQCLLSRLPLSHLKSTSVTRSCRRGRRASPPSFVSPLRARPCT